MEQQKKQDNEEYSSFLLSIGKEIETQQKHTAKEIEKEYNMLLQEISNRKKRESQRKEKYVRYILKNNKFENYDNIISYDLRDLIIMYEKIKNDKKNFFSRIINFFINQ
jgi:hypothetical protein